MTRNCAQLVKSWKTILDHCSLARPLLEKFSTLSILDDRLLPAYYSLLHTLCDCVTTSTVCRRAVVLLLVVVVSFPPSSSSPSHSASFMTNKPRENALRLPVSLAHQQAAQKNGVSRLAIERLLIFFLLLFVLLLRIPTD